MKAKTVVNSISCVRNPKENVFLSFFHLPFPPFYKQYKYYLYIIIHIFIIEGYRDFKNYYFFEYQIARKNKGF